MSAYLGPTVRSVETAEAVKTGETVMLMNPAGAMLRLLTTSDVQEGS